MTLERIPASGVRVRIRSTSPRKSLVPPNRRIRRSTPALACWKLTSNHGTTPAVPAIASSRTGRISAGWR